MSSLNVLEDAKRLLHSEVVKHANHDKALSLIHTLVDFAIPGQVFLLVGAPGAGASTVARALRRRLLEGCAPFNPYYAIDLTAQVPKGTRFAWKHFWEIGLEVLDEPRYGQRRRASESIRGVTDFYGNAEFRGEGKYQEDFENALTQRNCQAVIVQHADFMMRRLRENEWDLPLEVFHQITRKKHQSVKAIILAGDYQLLDMLSVKSRSDFNAITVEIPVYSLESEDDATAFISLLRGYERLLEAVIPKGMLIDNADVIFERSCGSPGVIKKSLNRALAKMESLGKKLMTWSLLRSRLLTKKQQEKYMKELALGRAKLPSEGLNEQGSEKPVKQSQKLSKRRVGERNPSRDPVGLPE